MGSLSTSSTIPTPPPEAGSYSRPSPAQATGDAIPLLVDDTYHVFHLTTPPFTRHHPPRLRSSWWRMHSKNLVDWTRDAEACIRPGEDKSSPDADGAWTGAAVLGPDGAMNIFYTGYNLSQDGKQTILRIKSHGRLGTHLEYPGTDIVFNGEGKEALEPIDFRDPYVFFNELESTYWMLIASRLVSGPYWSRGCIALLKSTDLTNWTFAPQPLYSPNDLFCPECPELFSLPLPDGTSKWYLVYSRFQAPNAGTVYRVADSPYGPFHIPRDGSQGRLDGRRWYAAKSCPKAGDSSRRIYFGWTGDYVGDEGKWLWGGDMGVPREISVGANGYLCTSPVVEMLQLFESTSELVSPKVVPPRLCLSAIACTKVTFPDIPASTKTQEQDMLVHFDMQHCDAHSFGLMLQADATGKGHRLQIVPCSQDKYTVTLLTDFAPLDDFWADQYALHLPRPIDGPELVRHESVSLVGGVTLIMRGQLIEIFVGGRSISFRLPVPSPKPGVPVYDDAHQVAVDGHQLGWYVEDGEVVLENVVMRRGGLLLRMDA